MSDTLEQALARIEVLEARVQEARDADEIRALKARYAEACDLGYNADAMAELFAPDGVWEFTNAWGIHRGRDEIHRFMVEAGKQIKWALHFMIGPTITVHSPVSASGKWYILELATMVGVDDPDGRDAVILSGTYHDRYVKIDGDWKFEHVKVNIDQCSNLADGWVKQPLRGN
jgi:hypothetical protein